MFRNMKRRIANAMNGSEISELRTLETTLRDNADEITDIIIKKSGLTNVSDKVCEKFKLRLSRYHLLYGLTNDSIAIDHVHRLFERRHNLSRLEIKKEKAAEESSSLKPASSEVPEENAVMTTESPKTEKNN